MPKETFYDPTCVEGQTPEDEQFFTVSWARGEPVWVNDVQMDESGIERLIKILERAMKQSYKQIGVSLYVPGEGRIDLTGEQFEDLSTNYTWDYRPGHGQGILDFLNDNPQIQVQRKTYEASRY